MITRREFVKRTSTLAAINSIGLTSTLCKNSNSKNKSMLPVTIGDFDSNFEREPLIRPFGFTGGYMTEIWQTMSWMLTESGHQKVGLCTQNVLWSDAKVFQSYSEAMFSYHPYNGTSWTKTKQGFFELGEDYYDKSGGILTDSEHYLKMFEHGK